MALSLSCSLHSVVSQFLVFKSASQAAPRTVADYGKTISAFFRAYPRAWRNAAAMRAAFLDWASRPMAPDTFNRNLVYLRSFWRWAVDEGLQPADEASPFRGLKRRSSPGAFRLVDAEHVRELLSMPDRTMWTGGRDYALMVFTLDSAARPGEALKLRLSDFDFNSLAVTVPAEVAKTRRARIVPFSLETERALKKFLKSRPAEWPDEVPVFASIYGEALSVAAWGRRLRRYELKDGFRFKPYDLRHAACTLHLRAGMNAFVLQRLMGHASPAMTQRYVHLDTGDLRREQDRCSPVASLLPARHERRRVKARIDEV